MIRVTATVMAFLLLVLPVLTQAQFEPRATFRVAVHRVTLDIHDEFTGRTAHTVEMVIDEGAMSVGPGALLLRVDPQHPEVLLSMLRPHRPGDRFYDRCRLPYLLADTSPVGITEITYETHVGADGIEEEAILWAITPEQARLMSGARQIRLRICRDVYELPRQLGRHMAEIMRRRDRATSTTVQ